ncbi:class I SAM-dependent methyltransferase [soil metagenome]
MDDPDADPRLLRKALRYIRAINILLGYTRVTLNYLDQFSARWKRGETIHIVDYATGSADLPRAILKWADRRGWDVRVTGIDLHEHTASQAQAAGNDPRLKIVCGSALDVPFANGSFDYAITSLFLHHLDTPDAARVLSSMAAVSRRGIIAGDLLRNRRAYTWIKLMTLLANPIVKHDAPASVAQGFTRDEVLTMRDAACVGFAQYRKHFGHRFVLAGEKD